ncbi:MAG: exonuclease SbcCD subunit D [Bacillota bacterium]|nr:exonuclease SbcCD subunit D [Bacillota bacterium]
MVFVHLSDLHLGKILYEMSMLEDQQYILEQIVQNMTYGMCPPDAVLISGDIYDRSIAPAEALVLFESFLRALIAMKIKVFIIGGNHDSAERLAYCSSLMTENGVFVSGSISSMTDGDGFRLSRHVLEDEYGEVDVYLLPYVNKKMVRHYFPDDEIRNWTDAVDILIRNGGADFSRRCVILAHQYISGASPSDSEEHPIGGLDVVDAKVFQGFDYVALGHLHRPQHIAGHKHIRYCGSPLPYSFSEAGHKKSMTVVRMGENKGDVEIDTVELVPRREMVELRGYFDELVENGRDDVRNRDHYYRIVLKDRENLHNPIGRLRKIYPNILLLEYDAAESRNTGVPELTECRRRNPYELFVSFFESQNRRELSETQKEYLQELLESVFEED